MDTYHLFVNLAAAGYNCDAYGAGSYNNSAECSTTYDPGTDESGASDGDLAYTGESLFLVAGLAVVVIVASAIAIFKAVRKKT